MVSPSVIDLTNPISRLVSEEIQSPLIIDCCVEVGALVFVGVRVTVGVGDGVKVRVGVVILVGVGVVVEVTVGSRVGVEVREAVLVGTRVGSFASGSGFEPLEQAVNNKTNMVMTTTTILFKSPLMF